MFVSACLQALPLGIAEKRRIIYLSPDGAPYGAGLVLCCRAALHGDVVRVKMSYMSAESPQAQAVLSAVEGLIRVSWPNFAFITWRTHCSG